LHPRFPSPGYPARPNVWAGGQGARQTRREPVWGTSRAQTYPRTAETLRSPLCASVISWHRLALRATAHKETGDPQLQAPGGEIVSGICLLTPSLHRHQVAQGQRRGSGGFKPIVVNATGGALDRSPGHVARSHLQVAVRLTVHVALAWPGPAGCSRYP
jgi:hypothetical protein